MPEQTVNPFGQLVKDVYSQSGVNYTPTDDDIHAIEQQYKGDHKTFLKDFYKEAGVSYQLTDNDYKNIDSTYGFKPIEEPSMATTLTTPQTEVPAEQPQTYMQKELRDKGLIQDEGQSEEEGFLGKLGGTVGNSFMTGMNSLNSWAADAPAFIYDLAGAPFRAVGLNVPTSQDFKDTPLENISDFYKQNAKAYEQKVQEINPARGNGVIASFENGDIEGGILNLAGGIAESAPASIAMMLSGGATAPTIIGGAAIFGAGKAQEMDENAPEMDYDKRRVIAAINGTLEGVFETYLGSGAVGKSLAGIIKNEGKDIAQEQAKRSLSTVFADMITKNPWMAPLGEGFEEVGTQISQNLVDKYSGYRPNISITDGVGDSFLSGVGMGGIHGAVIGLAKKAMEEKQQPSTDSGSQLTVNPDVERQDLIQQQADIAEGLKHESGNIIKVRDNNGNQMFVKSGDMADPDGMLQVINEDGTPAGEDGWIHASKLNDHIVATPEAFIQPNVDAINAGFSQQNQEEQYKADNTMDYNGQTLIRMPDGQGRGEKAENWVNSNGEVVTVPNEVVQDWEKSKANQPKNNESVTGTPDGDNGLKVNTEPSYNFRDQPISKEDAIHRMNIANDMGKANPIQHSNDPELDALAEKYWPKPKAKFKLGAKTYDEKSALTFIDLAETPEDLSKLKIENVEASPAVSEALQKKQEEFNQAKAEEQIRLEEQARAEKAQADEVHNRLVRDVRNFNGMTEGDRRKTSTHPIAQQAANLGYLIKMDGTKLIITDRGTEIGYRGKNTPQSEIESHKGLTDYSPEVQNTAEHFLTPMLIEGVYLNGLHPANARQAILDIQAGKKTVDANYLLDQIDHIHNTGMVMLKSNRDGFPGIEIPIDEYKSLINEEMTPEENNLAALIPDDVAMNIYNGSLSPEILDQFENLIFTPNENSSQTANGGTEKSIPNTSESQKSKTITDEVPKKLTDSKVQNTDNKSVENAESQESLQKKQLENEDSEKAIQPTAGIVAEEGEDTPQEKQGEGVQEGLEENVISVPLSLINPTEGHTKENTIDRHSSRFPNEAIRVSFDSNGNLNIEDGNHRYFEAIQRGDENINIVFGTQLSRTEKEYIDKYLPQLIQSISTDQPVVESLTADPVADQIAQQGINLNPTEAQKEAGNYKKAHVTIQGMDIAIENPKGSFRKGVDEDGKAWETEMKSHYGYFNGTEGKDGDHIDVFIGENPESPTVYVIDQVFDKGDKSGLFDESKVMLGYNSPKEAADAYMANYDESFNGLSDLTAVSVEDFKKWLYDSAKQHKPFADYKSTPEPVVKKSFTSEPVVKESLSTEKVIPQSENKEPSVTPLENKLAEKDEKPTEITPKPETTVFKKDDAMAAIERLKKKLGGDNVGVGEPESEYGGNTPAPAKLSLSDLADAQTVAGYFIESGNTSFPDYAKSMIDALGDGIKPYLKSIYNGIRDFPGMEQHETKMTDYNDVKKLDIEQVLNPIENKVSNNPFIDGVLDKTINQSDIYELEYKNFAGKTFNVKVRFNDFDGTLISFTDTETGKNGALMPSEVISSKLIEAPKETANKKGFVSAIKDKLGVEKLNIVAIRKIAAENGLNDIKDTTIQEYVELAIISKARDITSQEISQDEKYKQIVELYNSQPTISMRSSERIEKQQYSTPLPMSFMAGEFVNAINPQSLLEPSAGNGMMIFNTDPNIVIANEIDLIRLENLKEQGFKEVTNQDGTTEFDIDNVDAIVTNPPFGHSEARDYKGYKISGLDEQMVVNALENLAPNGRASIIIGGHTKYKSNGTLAGEKAFFNYLYNFYNVSDVINMDGGLFSKQGTSFPTRLILINGRRNENNRVYAPLEKNTNTDIVTTFDELQNRVNKASNEKTILQPAIPERNANGTGSRSGNGRTPSTERTGTLDFFGTDTGSNKPDSGQAGDAGSTNRSEGTPKPNDGNGRDSDIVDGNKGNDEPGTGGNDGRIQPEDTSKLLNRPDELAGDKVEVDLSQEKTPYPARSKSEQIGSVVPTNVAQTLADVLSTFKDIDEYTRIKLGYESKDELFNALAAEQIDSVAMAIYQIENGGALIIGDMTGVGKGRQAAAILRYAHIQGKKPIFVTEKAHLFSDIYRDLRDIGSADLKPFIFNSKSANSDPTIVDENGVVVYSPLSEAMKRPIFQGNSIPSKYDYAVLTYSQLNAGVNKVSAKKDFFTSISEDNILVLDESHNAGGEGNTGTFMTNAIPNTKGVVFLSGTFAKRADNMPIYALKTSMSDANMSNAELIEAIKTGGVPLQEIMSKNLTQSGQMIRRERDFTGVTIDWKTIEDADTHFKAYDSIIKVFNDLIQFQREYIDPIIEERNEELAAMQANAEHTAGTADLGINNVPFASKTFNLTRQLLFSLKAKNIADEAIAELKAGRRPVIAVANTMEGFMNELGAIGEKISNYDFSTTLMKGLHGLFRFTETDGMGEHQNLIMTVDDLPKDARDRYYEIEDFIKNMSVGISISPIDVIKDAITKAGYSIGEMTGRTNELVFNTDGTAQIQRRTNTDKKKITRDFQSGKLDALIMNQSASTGISLHASSKVADQRQRTMLSAQTQLDVNTEVQMRGRIDRTGQVVRGAYRYILSPIPAEQRMTMMFKVKLKSLDANTTSSQKSKTNEIEIVDFLNKYGDKICVDHLKEDSELNEKLLDPMKFEGKSEAEIETFVAPDGAALKIAGRVALLPINEQQKFYDEITEKYNTLINYLNDTNSNDLEITTLQLKAETKEKIVIAQGKGGVSPFAQDSYREKVEIDVLKKPLKAEEIKKEIEKHTEGLSQTDYRNHLIEKLDTYTDALIETEIQKSNDDFNSKEQSRIDKANKIFDKQKVTDADERQQLLENYLNASQNIHDTSLTTRVDKIRRKADGIRRVFNMFPVGKTIMVPNTSDITPTTTYTEGILMGYKLGAKLNPSTITAIFATLDSRRKIEVPLSKADFLNASYAESMQMRHRITTTLDNWDEKIPTKNRRIGYIITGNILQAFAGNEGQLIAYTDIDGNIKEGILLPENYKPSEQQMRVQITKKLDNIRNGEIVRDISGNVLFRKQSSGGYAVEVPLSKQSGGMYFLDPGLRDLVIGRDFRQMGGRMVGAISETNLEPVLEYMAGKFNTSANVDIAQSVKPREAPTVEIPTITPPVRTPLENILSKEKAVETFGAKLLPVAEYRHTQTGQILYTVNINGRSEEYDRMSNIAKKYNPYNKSKPWSRYSKGFLFNTKDDAIRFKNEVEGNNSEISEPQNDYLRTTDKNSDNEVNQPKRKYQTKEGETLQYSLFSDTDNGSGDTDLQRQADRQQNPSLRRLSPGERSSVEMKYSLDKNFVFDGKNNIESTDDVAYLFKNLESKSIENMFACFVKDGKPTIIHISMGNVSGTVMNFNVLADGITRFSPDKVYLIHNHPSGNLIQSQADLDIHNKAIDAFGDVIGDHIIINLTSGDYATFRRGSSSHRIETRPTDKSNSEKEYKVYNFDKKVFKQDSVLPTKITQSFEVASFISSQRFTDGNKLSALMLDRGNNIQAYLHLSDVDFNSQKSVNELIKELQAYVGRFGASNIILSGTRPTSISSLNNLRALKAALKNGDVTLLDYVSNVRSSTSYDSTSDDGVLEDQAPYGKNDIISQVNEPTTPLERKLSERSELLDVAGNAFKERPVDKPTTRQMLQSMRDMTQEKDGPIYRWQKTIIDKMGGKLTDDANPFRDKKLAPGRLQTLTETFFKDYITPLVDVAARISKEVGKQTWIEPYLIAKHAPERNASIRAAKLEEWKDKGFNLTKWAKENKPSDEELQAKIDEQVAEGNYPSEQEIDEQTDELMKQDFSGIMPLNQDKNGNVINPEFEEDPDALANAIVEQFESIVSPELVTELNEKRKAIADAILVAQVKAKTISQAEADNYKSRWKHYVPLRGWMDDASKRYTYTKSNNGSGTAVKHAGGRGSLAESPLGYLHKLAFRSISDQVDSEIKQSLLRFIGNNYSPEFKKMYQVKQAYFVKDGVDPETGETLWTITTDKPSKEDIDSGNAIMEAYNEHLKFRTAYQAKEHEVVISRADGTAVVIVFDRTDPNLLEVAQSFNNNNVMFKIGNTAADNAMVLNALVEQPIPGTKISMRNFTNFFKSMLTQFNLRFPITNFPRDFAESNIDSYIVNGKTINLKTYKESLSAIDSYLRNTTDKSGLRDEVNNFYENGGTTGYTHDKTPVEYQKEMMDEINMLVKNGLTKSRTRRLEEWLTRYNQRFEDSVRFSVYMNARKLGYTIKDAAFRSRNATVDFNIRGKLSPVLGTMYGFFEVSMNSLAKTGDYFSGGGGTLKTIGKDPKVRKRAIKVATAFVMLGFLEAMLNDWITGDDDDKENDYYNRSRWMRHNYINIPLPIKSLGLEKLYFSIALPPGWRTFKGLGAVTYDYLIGQRGKVGLGESIGNAAMNFVDGFSPVPITNIYQNGKWHPESLVIPMALKPWYEVAINENYMGARIAKEPFTEKQRQEIASSALGKDNVNVAAKFFTDLLFKAGGGDSQLKVRFEDDKRKEVNYWMDWNPSKIEHLITGYGGGTLDTFSDLMKTGLNMIRPDKKVDFADFPFVNAFIRKTPAAKWTVISDYYRLFDDVKGLDSVEKEYEKQAIESGDLSSPKADKYRGVAGSTYLQTYQTTLDVYKKLIDTLSDQVNYKTGEGTDAVIDMMKQATQSIEELKTQNKAK